MIQMSFGDLMIIPKPIFRISHEKPVILSLQIIRACQELPINTWTTEIGYVPVMNYGDAITYRLVKVYSVEDYRVVHSLSYPAPVLSLAMSVSAECVLKRLW